MNEEACNTRSNFFFGFFFMLNRGIGEFVCELVNGLICYRNVSWSLIHRMELLKSGKKTMQCNEMRLHWNAVKSEFLQSRSIFQDIKFPSISTLTKDSQCNFLCGMLILMRCITLHTIKTKTLPYPSTAHFFCSWYSSFVACFNCQLSSMPIAHTIGS